VSDDTNEGYRILYKKHKGGKVGYWEGWIAPALDASWIVVMKYASGIHDSPQTVEERIKEGKQGRTAKEQAWFRLDSRTNSKLDSGYVYSRARAEETSHIVDASGNYKPMLANKIRDHRGTIDTETTCVQLKYNGHRCLIMNINGVTKAFSRNGKEIPGVPHILEKFRLEPGEIVDGEIYRHGWKLQKIASAAKRYQVDSKQLTFVAYDYIDTDNVFLDRLETLKSFVEQGIIEPGTDAVKIAPTIILGDKPIEGLLRKSISNGYEGLILRLDGYPYEVGRRSSGLLKVKHLEDAEFQVIDVIPSRDGWGILVCALPNGSTFKTSAPGTMQDKTEILKNKHKYIGRRVTVEYPETTADGIPFHAVATGFREDL
jgi:ATP-dependent DNA ligase